MPVAYNTQFSPPIPISIAEVSIDFPLGSSSPTPAKIELNMILDSGADKSMIPAQVVIQLERAIGMALPYTAIQVEDFDGNISKIKAYHLTIKPFIHNQELSRPFNDLLLLEINGKDGILGRDIMNSFDVLLSGLHSEWGLVT